jgi:hypothetical protein
MKKPSPDLNWLPKPEEWDFRSVTEAECRAACHWEYARDIWLSLQAAMVKRTENGEHRRKVDDTLRRDAVTKSPLFPRAWASLSAAERASVLAEVTAPPALQVRTLQEFISRNWPAVSKAEFMNRLGQGAYVIRPNFSALGVEAIIREFEKWARKEAKEFAQAPRARAAEPPFDMLKWLSVFRLEEKRRDAGITYEKAQEALAVYRRERTKADPYAVFPVYASHGAWSKARRDAERTRAKVIGDSAFLLKGWCLAI